MTGRAKIEAAFSGAGTPQIPAVICYESIYVRDHWDTLTSCPWWYQHDPDIERQMLWRREVIARIAQDWFVLPSFYTREEQDVLTIDARPDGAFRIDKRTGKEEKLPKPAIGGWSATGGTASFRPQHPPTTTEEIDRKVPLPLDSDPVGLLEDGTADLASRLLQEFGHQLYPVCHVASPFWGCYSLWGFERMMTMVAERPELIEYACRRLLASKVRSVRHAASLGAAGIWIEECFTDMISAEAFGARNVPFLRSLVDEIRAAGMRSIYYFCGNPAGKWDLIASVGADALSLEESKKGFAIDIEGVVDRAQGSCTVLGNLDAVGILQDGSEDQVRAEIARQIEAGRQNGSRFIMSLGSPVTPATPVERVHRYCELVHELGTP